MCSNPSLLFVEEMSFAIIYFIIAFTFLRQTLPCGATPTPLAGHLSYYHQLPYYQYQNHCHYDSLTVTNIVLQYNVNGVLHVRAASIT